MRIRKKYSLAIFFSVTSTIMVFLEVKSPELTAYGIIAAGILGAFGAADVFGKKHEVD